MKRLYARIVLAIIGPAVRLAFASELQQGGLLLSSRKVVAVVKRQAPPVAL
jgi:hypothetical protein